MSYTTVKAVWPGERAEELTTLRNSHGSAPVVWNAMAVKYLGFRDYEYATRTEELWPIYKREDMPDHHRAVLMMTYLNSLVMKRDYKRAASDIRKFILDFPQTDGHCSHWGRIAEIFDTDPECPAIGFHMSSADDDPFKGEWNEAIEDYEPPDWKSFWDVYREADNAKQEKTAVAWMRRQAKEIDPSIADDESIFICARVISGKIQELMDLLEQERKK